MNLISEWILKIQEPSGEIRLEKLQKENTIGRDTEATIQLRDPTILPIAATLSLRPTSQLLPGLSPFWLKMTSSQYGSLGDIPIKEAAVPQNFVFKIGETRLELILEQEQRIAPPFPSGVLPWLTNNPEGIKLLWNTKRASKTPLSIYLNGETGTGKEVLAHLIHHWSHQASGPFVPLHCGALPLSLVESELFGHEKGAFTGAHKQRAGALLRAHNGTLFLDEIGDLPSEIQVKLLRFLESGEIRPVGADHIVHSKVRIICATHKPLEKLVEQGLFRRDLYYRIASVTLKIPSLKERLDDIVLLSHKFIKALNKNLSPKAVERLQVYPWSGNVRELRHAIERAAGLAGEDQKILNENDFSFLYQSETKSEFDNIFLGGAPLKLKEMERIMLVKALKATKGNRAHAAKRLGVARSTLFEMLKRHRIKGPRHQEVWASQLEAS